MSEYYYLLSSLPLPREGEPPPLPVAGFMSRCADWLDAEEIAQLTALALIPPDQPASATPHPTIAAWYDWETDLRNRLALLRTPQGEHDAEADRREDGACFPGNDRVLQEILAASHPQERERLLDHARWQRLDDLDLGWSFGFDRLCIYKLKLMLAEPWTRREAEAGRRTVGELVEQLYRHDQHAKPAAA